MKNKRGFTLIEIIICISLIAIISTISIVIFIKNKDYSNITKKILEAANVYIATEKDEQGNTYEYGINNGGKGARINVKELVNKGYVDEKLYKTLEKEYKLENDESYLVWVTNSIKGSSEKECGTNAHEYKVNWEKREDNVVYLCPYDSNKSGSSDESLLINKMLKQGYNTNCENSLETSSLCLSHGKNISDDENLEDIYYFKGKVDNNYIKFEGLDKLFRIVRTTENNGIKIIEDNKILLSNNNVLTDGDSVYFYKKYIKKGSYEGRSITSRYSLIKYYPYKTNDECSCEANDSTYKVERWNDVTKQVLVCQTTSSWKTCPETVTLPSPVYEYVYRPLETYYTNDIKNTLEKYINTNYKWCGDSYDTSINKNNLTNFKCKSETRFSSDFGLLTYQEYLRSGIYNPKHIKYEMDYLNLFDYGNIEDELTFDVDIAESPGENGWHRDPQYTYVRIAYVINDNIKVLSGTGTKTDPYIISE